MQANGLSQRRPPPPLGRRATADAAVRLMQAVLTFERLSSSPSRTLRPVFIQEIDTQQLYVSISSSR
jgi:hypothetical protein